MMDKFDQKIILDLMNQGVENNAILAHKYQVTERTIHTRISKLIDNNSIKLLVAPNIVLLGYNAWARIGIKVQLGSLNRMARKLAAHPKIYWVALTLGRFDIMISVYFDTADQLANFINSELIELKGIRDIETILLVSPRKYNHFSWAATSLTSDRSPLRPGGNTTDSYSHYKLQDVERRILDVLVAEGPVRPKEMASKLGISESKIRKHMKVMRQNEVYKIEVVPMVWTMEYVINANIGITIHGQFPHKIIDSINENRGVYLASVTLGRFNLLIGTRFSNLDLLNVFLREFLPSIPGISTIESYLIVKLLKYHNVVWPDTPTP